MLAYIAHCLPQTWESGAPNGNFLARFPEFSAWNSGLLSPLSSLRPDTPPLGPAEILHRLLKLERVPSSEGGLEIPRSSLSCRFAWFLGRFDLTRVFCCGGASRWHVARGTKPGGSGGPALNWLSPLKCSLSQSDRAALESCDERRPYK